VPWEERALGDRASAAALLASALLAGSPAGAEGSAPAALEAPGADWNLLARPVTALQTRLEDAGITFTVDLAFIDQYADRVLRGQHNYGTFAWRTLGDWKLTSSERWGQGRLNWNLLGAVGLDYDTGSQTIDGNIGSVSVPHTNVVPDPAALDELFWTQIAAAGRFVVHAGKINQNTHFDANRVANDGFRQFLGGALENNPSIPWPEYGGLGALFRLQLGSDAYVMLGAADSSSTEPFAFWKTVDDGSWYQLAELDLTRRIPGLGLGHYRLTPWHNHLSGEDGWGVGLSFDQELGSPHPLAFFRFGVGDEDVTPVETFVSGGLAWQAPFARSGDVIGLGVAWSDPSPSAGARNETLLELFYRVRLSPSIELTPDLQLVFDPANNLGDDLVVIPGIRLTFFFQ